MLPLKWLVDPVRPITYGIVQAGPDFPGGVPYIRPVDMSENQGVRDPSRLLRTDPVIAAAYRRSTVKAGDVVVTIGPSFGKLMVVPPDLSGANLTQGTARVAAATGVEPRFLYWALQAQPARQHWHSAVGGATFRALNLEPLSMTPMPQASIEEQRRIADFLDLEALRIDALIVKRHRQEALVRARIRAAINQKLDEVSEWVPLARLLRPERDALIAGPFGSDLSGSDLLPQGHTPVFNQRTALSASFDDFDHYVSSVKADELRRFRTRAGDVLVTGRGTIGKSVVVPQDAPVGILHPCLLRVRTEPDLMSPALLDECLRWSDRIRAELRLQSSATTIDVIYSGTLRRLPVPKCSPQRQEALLRQIRRWSEIGDRTSVKLKDQIRVFREHRESLVTAAVTGQIDVTTARGVDE